MLLPQEQADAEHKLAGLNQLWTLLGVSYRMARQKDGSLYEVSLNGKVALQLVATAPQWLPILDASPLVHNMWAVWHHVSPACSTQSNGRY